EHDGPRLERGPASWARELEGAVLRPSRHLGLGSHLGAGPGGPLGDARGVAGARHRAAQVTQPEPLVAGVAGDPARLRLPLEHDEVTRARAAELRRRRQPGGAAAHDGHVGRLAPDRSGAAHRGCSRSSSTSWPVCWASNAGTWAPQKNPWHRPMSARVRLRNPSRSWGGIALAAASRISPRVTRSQKHTIRPYSGSAAIRSGWQ